jgi:hypothetical protein
MKSTDARRRVEVTKLGAANSKVGGPVSRLNDRAHTTAVYVVIWFTLVCRPPHVVQTGSLDVHKIGRAHV